MTFISHNYLLVLLSHVSTVQVDERRNRNSAGLHGRGVAMGAHFSGRWGSSPILRRFSKAHHLGAPALSSSPSFASRLGSLYLPIRDDDDDDDNDDDEEEDDVVVVVSYGRGRRGRRGRRGG